MNRIFRSKIMSKELKFLNGLSQARQTEETLSYRVLTFKNRVSVFAKDLLCKSFGHCLVFKAHKMALYMGV